MLVRDSSAPSATLVVKSQWLHYSMLKELVNYMYKEWLCGTRVFYSSMF